MIRAEMAVPLYNHVPLTKFQRVLLGSASAVASLADPYRHASVKKNWSLTVWRFLSTWNRLQLINMSICQEVHSFLREDMVAVCSETTACKAVEHMRDRMMADVVGRQILEEKPRISSATIDLKSLARLPPNTFGRQYADMLNKYNISPDTRQVVRFVDDPELAYVLQRYRETHDFNHLLLGQPTNLRGEVAVKYFEAVQTTLPMCWLAAIGGSVRLTSQRRRRLARDLPWLVRSASRARFFMNVYFERRFHDDVDRIRRDLDLRLPASSSSS